MHPILFQYKFIAVYSFGAMLAIAFIVGMTLAGSRAKKVGLPSQQVVDFCLWLLIASVLGARSLYVLQSWDYYKFHLLEILMVQRGGLVFFGGLIAGLLFTFFYMRLKKWRFWQITDLLSPSLALAHAFGRIGCFLNGCCFGKLTNALWGVQFPDGSPAATEYGPLHLVHPTQLYEALPLFFLSLFLIRFDRKKKFEGATFLIYLILYSVLRFTLEFFRGDNPPVLSFMTISQVISSFVFVAAIFLFLKKKRSAQASSHVETN